MDDRTAVLHIAVASDDGGLAVTDRATAQLRDDLVHQHVTNSAPDIEQWRQVFAEIPCQWIFHDHQGRNPVDRFARLAETVGFQRFCNDYGLTDFNIGFVSHFYI